MKPGCFLKTIVFTTIVLAVIFYLFINKYDDYIAKPARKFIIGMITSDIKEKVETIKGSPERDSLLSYIDYAGERLLELKVINENAFSPVADSLRTYIKDNTIVPEELNKLKSLFEETLANEKRKKN